MDRFIGDLKNLGFNINAILKSNMDRFIGTNI